MAQAEVSVYPLRTADLSEVIDEFVNALSDPSLTCTTHAMSTHIVGESKVLFERVSEAYARVSDRAQVVLLLKVSNACPGEEVMEAGTADE